MNIPLILLLITLALHFVCLPKLFQKAGRPAWEGLVPIYNWFVWQKITSRPWWWILILFIPGVQFAMLMIMHVQLANSFEHRGFTNRLLAAVAPFYILPKMAFNKDVKYIGNIDWSKEGTNKAHEWTDAILFALIAAFIIRTFLLEAFTIPTPSMERSMLVGDYLFVSKARYGAKLPETPIAFPLAHHTIPILNCKSYLEWQKLDYHRLPGWADIERGDPVVFNYPEGDTVIVGDEVENYYSMLRDLAYKRAKNPSDYIENKEKYMSQVRKKIVGKSFNHVHSQEQKKYRTELSVRPKDKKENYVKRCVAIAGDVLEIKDRQIYINGSPQTEFTKLQFNYHVLAKGGVPFSDKTKKDLKEEIELNYSNFLYNSGSQYIMSMTDEQLKGFEERGLSDQINTLVDTIPQNLYNNAVFPHSPDYPWTKDNFGPLTMPKAGETVTLDRTNICIYERLIRVYEENELQVKDDGIYINGQKTDSYTFKLNYYWLMGDNRHNSLDSRYWGFVPEDHVVGRPAFTWLSLDKELGWFDGKIRWSRMFRGVK